MHQQDLNRPPLGGESPRLNGLVGPDPADEQELEKLFGAWKRDTAHQSSVSVIVSHPAYQKILAMGIRALPWMLRATRDRGTLWFGALEQITREYPAPEGASAKARREAWLKWGQEKGLLCK
jgi:hypothetical protein